MSITLRALCIIGAAVVFIGIVRRIKSSKIRIDDSIFWILLSGLLVLIAIFPGIAHFFSGLFGFQATSNFIFVVVIAALVVKEFANTMQISMLKHRVNELAQEEALSDKEEGE